MGTIVCRRMLKVPIVVLLLSLRRRRRIRNSNHYAKITVDGYGETFSIYLPFGRSFRISRISSSTSALSIKPVSHPSSQQPCRTDNKSVFRNVIKIIISPKVIDCINSIWPLIISIGNCTSPFDMLMNVSIPL